MNLRDECLQALQSTNVQAFLAVIAQGESSNTPRAYRTLVGGVQFDGDLSQHPRIAVKTKFGWSSAFGKYQIMAAVQGKVKTDTYDGLAAQLGPSMEPAEQDIKAVALIRRRGALQAVLNGKLDEAISLCNREWASLPDSPYGQPTRTRAQAKEVFEAYGGRTETSQAPPDSFVPEPILAAPPSVVPKKVGGFMAPLVIPILSAIAELIPSLGKLGFGSGSEVAQRNVAAGAMVAAKIVEATNAVNIQEAAEKIQSDPAALQAARDAVSEVVQLIEAGGGGIDGARKQAASPDSPPIWKQGAFWISILLIAMPFMLLVDLFYVHPDAYEANLRTQIVTAVLLTIGMVGSFWLGTTFNSGKKDSVIAGLAK